MVAVVCMGGNHRGASSVCHRRGALGPQAVSPPSALQSWPCFSVCIYSSSPWKLCQGFTPGAHDLETLAEIKPQTKTQNCFLQLSVGGRGLEKRNCLPKVGARDGQRGLGQMPRKERVEAAIEQLSNSS